MKIALIIENSQAAKSEIVHNALKSVAEPQGHTVHHYGMYTPEDKASLTYVMNGLLAGILLNSKAADFVVTGCGTGMGSMLACNSMPGVFCGLVADPPMPSCSARSMTAIAWPCLMPRASAGRPNSTCRIVPQVVRARARRRLSQGARGDHGQEPRHPEATQSRFLQGHGGGARERRSGSARKPPSLARSSRNCSLQTVRTKPSRHV